MVDTIIDGLFGKLPDEILGCIVSFLPNESALETSLISTRWRYLWNQVVVKYGAIEDISVVVAEFLACFEELDPLKHPRKLQFHFDKSNALFATIATNSKLLLDFSTEENENERRYELQFKLNKDYITQHLVQPNFLVKTLYLKSVSYLTSEVALSIVSNLDHLQNLTIIECNGLQSLFIESESKLKKLTILDCLQLKSLHLRTSKLKSFRFRGPLPWIWPESHFNLTDAMLDFRLGTSCSDFKSQDFNITLLTIKNSQFLTLCEWTFKKMIWPSSGNFIFYKLRELWWIDNYKDENNIDALVSFLKLCPALEQLYLEIDPICYSDPSSKSCLIQAIKYTELEHLKLIKFIGFTSQVKEISVAKSVIQLVKGKPPRIETSDGSCMDME
ncbi:hypothetical protein Lal_00000511 [Lupinus albus]|uniref:Putative F-box domain, leucine-rich repeat domain, L domain-containing protein n=1 Tax=Lupinus albus TaxID=3870 RepID=A0A6A5LR66_LUPAL|nr:putative F-box domain, leucine-rich repeat domain, L domain-containing protein [Lupinus albus]KAF1861092.1 hypothetical protein Lal_00000511 [Lupinus albus]